MTKQQQAPGELEHVRAFVNTVDIEEGAEGLAGGADLARWLAGRGLAPAGVRVTDRELRWSIELREAIRAILLAHTDRSSPPVQACETLDRAARSARVQLRFDPHGSSTLEPARAGVEGALGRLLAIIDRSIADGTWLRLKACRDHACEWGFYDHTKNRSGTWCTMEVCGNRAKARAYRGRQAPPSRLRG